MRKYGRSQTRKTSKKAFGQINPFSLITKGKKCIFHYAYKQNVYAQYVYKPIVLKIIEKNKSCFQGKFPHFLDKSLNLLWEKTKNIDEIFNSKRLTTAGPQFIPYLSKYTKTI